MTELEASLQFATLPLPGFVPAAAMSYDGLRRITQLLAEQRPQSIIEIGLGYTSIALWEYCQLTGAKYVGINDPGPWHDRILDEARARNVDTSVLHSVPLINGVFDVSRFPEPHYPPANMIVVDGPWDPKGRADGAMIQWTIDRGNRDTIYVIDDTHRDGSRKHVETLIQRHGRWNYRIETVSDSLCLRELGPNGRTTTALVPHYTHSRLSVAMTHHCNRPERLEYLDRTLSCLRRNLIVSGDVSIVIGSESRGCLDPVTVESLAEKHVAEILWNPADGTWAGNIRRAISACATPYVLFLEDDWAMRAEYSLEPALDFLDSDSGHDFGFVWLQVLRPPVYEHAVAITPDVFDLGPNVPYGYTNQPHIRRRVIGDLEEPTTAGDAEHVLKAFFAPKVRAGEVRIGMTGNPRLFSHLGKVSAKRS